MLSKHKREWHRKLSQALVLFSHSVVLTLCTPMDCRVPATLSMGFPRQEYWSGLTFPSPGDFPDPRIEPLSSTLVARSLPLSHLGTPISTLNSISSLRRRWWGQLPEWSIKEEGRHLSLDPEVCGMKNKKKKTLLRAIQWKNFHKR